MIFEWATGGKCRGEQKDSRGRRQSAPASSSGVCSAGGEEEQNDVGMDRGIAWTGTGARSEVGPGLRKWRNQDCAMGTGLTASGPMGRQDTSVQGSEGAIDFSCASYVRRLAIPSSSP
jgi:hypothetical protein